jgi:hypothetical protein
MIPFRNFALGDILYSDKKHEEEMAKLQALDTIANKSTSTNILIYLIPIGVLLIGGIILAVALKKKKG